LINNAIINHLEIKSTTLIIDFEITDYAIYNKNMFIDYKKTSSFIGINSSQRLIVSNRDILIVYLKYDKKMNILILINVLLVFNLKVNFISIIKLLK
jgi:hypothetical protein